METAIPICVGMAVNRLILHRLPDGRRILHKRFTIQQHIQHHVCVNQHTLH